MPSIKLLLLAAALIVPTVSAVAQSPRQRVSFNSNWLFARYGLQADGQRLPEPGLASTRFHLSASSEQGPLQEPTGVQPANTAQLAMDGNPDTRWCASSADGGQWLAIDLGGEQTISRADIQWETPGQAYGCVIERTVDGKKWQSLPGVARKIRITVTSLPAGKWASIREVHLFDGLGVELKNTPIDGGLSPSAVAFNDTAWRPLNVPHDWGIEGPFRADLPGNTAKLPWKGIGWYRKHFTLAPEDMGKRIFVDFDGAMANAEVWLNGKPVGSWPYGYQGFRVELTDNLRFGADNVLAVRLDTEHWDSRWYPGAGIYRNVWLVKTAPTHVAQWGVFVTTPRISPMNGEADIAVTIDNQAAQNARVSVSTAILELGPDDSVGRPVAATIAVEKDLPANGSGQVNLVEQVPAPRLWDIGAPNRYVARTVVSEGGRIVDVYDQPFGFRTIEFTHDDGFHLNGKRVQIQGTCNHHDLGSLGAAFNTSGERRQLEILKAMGCNALRTSHNPPAPELLDLADKMGFLVMCEAFDCFEIGKGPDDYSRLFDQWHEKDLGAMVRHFRNHPSIILWSAGNEIPEQHLPAKFHLFGDLRDIIHRFDTTRPATAAISLPKQTAFSGVELEEDVHGMNYPAGVYGGADLYGAFLTKPGHEKLPGYASESASTVSSRGEYPPCFPGQVSSYDLQAPEWGSLPDQEFTALDKYPAIAGEFVWTGFDYLGEPTPVGSSRSSYFGIVDLAGFPKDRFYLYQARWRPDFRMAHILPHWNWPGHEGKVIPVFVYTSGDSAELFLNGKSLGKKARGRFDYRLRWDNVIYQPGELKVIAYKGGLEWATDVVKTTEQPANLSLTPDRTTIASDGADLSYITLRVQDREGLTVPTANPLIKFSIQGPGEIVSTDNGDPTSFVSFQSHDRPAFHGLALVIVRAKPGATGPISIQAQSDGINGARVTLLSSAPSHL